MEGTNEKDEIYVRKLVECIIMKRETNGLTYEYYKRGITYVGDHYQRSKLSREDIKSLLKIFPKSLYIRNIYDFDCGEETDFWHIILDKFYEIDELPSKSTRKNLRKSLSVYTYRLATKEEILQYGYQIECEGAKRIGISPRYTQEDFLIFVERAYASQQEFWLGFDIETMEPAMWELISLRGDHIIENTERVSYRFKQYNPSYGLNWSIAKYYLKEKGYKYIDAGARSLTEHSNVQNFLIEKFGFRKAYCRMQVWMHPFLKLGLCLLRPFQGFFKRNNKLRGLFELCKYTD